MLFIFYLSCVVLVNHLLSPTGIAFITWLTLRDPQLLEGMPSYLSGSLKLFLINFPALCVVLAAFIKFDLSSRIDKQHNIAFRLLLAGMGFYFFFVVGRNGQDVVGRFLEQYISQGLLLSRILLTAGVVYTLMHPVGMGGGGTQDKAGGGASGGGGDDEAAMAALMGLMGGGGGAPKKGGNPMMGRPPKR